MMKRQICMAMTSNRQYVYEREVARLRDGEEPSSHARSIVAPRLYVRVVTGLSLDRKKLVNYPARRLIRACDIFLLRQEGQRFNANVMMG
jgi:hypothetical protein